MSSVAMAPYDASDVKRPYRRRRASAVKHATRDPVRIGRPPNLDCPLEGACQSASWVGRNGVGQQVEPLVELRAGLPAPYRVRGRECN